MTTLLDRFSLIQNQERNSRLKVAGVSSINEITNSDPIEIKHKLEGEVFGQNM